MSIKHKFSFSKNGVLVFPNCNALTRLHNNKNYSKDNYNGCGIIALKWFDLIDEESFDKLLINIKGYGTPMREIQAIIESKYQLKLKMVDIDIRTPNELSLFLNFLKNNLNDNQCILVKLLRTSKERKRYDNYSKGIVNSTPGHSFVFTKIKSQLHTLDPFSKSTWKTDIKDVFKLFRIWNSEQGYIHARFFIISGFENTFCKSINLEYDKSCNVIDDKYDEEDEDEGEGEEEDEEDEDEEKEEDEDEEGEGEKEKEKLQTQLQARLKI